MLNLLTFTLLAAMQTPPAQPTPSSPAEITAFVQALNSCTVARAASPHPLMRTFTVEHSITGPSAAGCNYRQTMPGKMAMVCALSEAGRKAMAAEIGVYAKGGPMSGATSAARPTWWGECQLEMPDGKRQPL